MIVVDIAYGTENLLPGSNGVFMYRESMFLRLGSTALSMGFSRPLLMSACAAFDVGTYMS